MDIDWLKSFTRSWQDRIDHGRVPHAVLLTGPVGVGKRAAAIWMAAERLGHPKSNAAPQYPVESIEHADLHWIAPPEDKSSIGIEQIRELVAEIGLTSYEGKGKVAIIEPADLMTTNAANSLLKTLEEPQGDSLLILVADKSGRLPATIFSRCQRIDIRAPAEGEGLAWLDRMHPGPAWNEALRLSDNAPLAAIDAIERLDTHASMGRDFSGVAQGAVSPLGVAARWSKLEAPFVLNWLARQVQQVIRATSGGSRRMSSGASGESVLERLDRRTLFCYLDSI